MPQSTMPLNSNVATQPFSNDNWTRQRVAGKKTESYSCNETYGIETYSLMQRVLVWFYEFHDG
jgi:hypothetical protein